MSPPEPCILLERLCRWRLVAAEKPEKVLPHSHVVLDAVVGVVCETDGKDKEELTDSWTDDIILERSGSVTTTVSARSYDEMDGGPRKVIDPCCA